MLTFHLAVPPSQVLRIHYQLDYRLNEPSIEVCVCFCWLKDGGSISNHVLVKICQLLDIHFFNNPFHLHPGHAPPALMPNKLSPKRQPIPRCGSLRPGKQQATRMSQKGYKHTIFNITRTTLRHLNKRNKHTHTRRSNPPDVQIEKQRCQVAD